MVPAAWYNVTTRIWKLLLMEQVNPMYSDPMDSCYNGEKEQGERI